jgi:hypothetical protein
VSLPTDPLDESTRRDIGEEEHTSRTISDGSGRSSSDKRKMRDSL